MNKFIRCGNQVKWRFLFLAILILAASRGVCADSIDAREDRMKALDAVVTTSKGVAERCEGCLSQLKREMAFPSETIMGIAGGPIDSGYLQNVMIRSFCSEGTNVSDEERVGTRNWARDKLNSEGKCNRDLRDRLILVIGHTGDASVIPQLIDILLHHPEGYLRFEAAIALDDIQDPSSIPALKRALETDTYARVRTGGCLGPRLTRRETVYSPTREAAARALKRMGVPVAAGAEVVDGRYAIPRLEPLLYSDKMPFQVLTYLAAIGGPDAESAINRFIESIEGDNDASPMVEFARGVLERSKAGGFGKPFSRNHWTHRPFGLRNGPTH